MSTDTIFNRYGGRIGLIEAAIEKAVASGLFAVIDPARTIDGGERIAHCLTAVRDLHALVVDSALPLKHGTRPPPGRLRPPHRVPPGRNPRTLLGSPRTLTAPSPWRRGMRRLRH
ncbi:hypothetical protein [Streptomyces alfalfae]|uniref:hypothetical protein n=1 Tax=Streptomyces alfalfae TaxID=1642299 RepID=UPI001E58B7AC|nr:hypothetical protein [Streptomyces alfalfae]